MEHECDDEANCNWCARYGQQIIGKGTGRRRNGRISKDLQNYSIIEIGQNTEKNLGDMGRLTITQTPVEDYRKNS